MSNQCNEMKVGVTPASNTKEWLIWRTLKYQGGWALPVGLLMSILGAFVVLAVAAPEFEATHILQGSHDFVLSKDFSDGPKDLAKNELPIIMSPEVVDKLLADPQFRSIPSFSDPELREREFRKRLSVSSGGTDDLLLITYRDSDKKQVAKVANAIAEIYIQERRRFDQQRLLSLERALTLPIDQARRNLEEARRQYEELAKKLVGKNPFATSTASKDAEVEQDNDRPIKAGIETADLVFAQKKLEYETTYFDKLNSRFLALRAEQGRGASMISRSPAREPTAPIEKWPINEMVLAGGLAFFLPLALAMLIESRKRR